MLRNSVLLPQPLGPSSSISSPGSSARLTWCSATLSPNRTVSPSTAMAILAKVDSARLADALGQVPQRRQLVQKRRLALGDRVAHGDAVDQLEDDLARLEPLDAGRGSQDGSAVGKRGCGVARGFETLFANLVGDLLEQVHFVLRNAAVHARHQADQRQQHDL